MTTEQQIEQGAKDYRAPRLTKIDTFTAGASFYEEKIMPGMISGFINWGNSKGLHRDKMGVWYSQQGFSSSVFAADDTELVNLFLSHLKQKDNAN